MVNASSSSTAGSRLLFGLQLAVLGLGLVVLGVFLSGLLPPSWAKLVRGGLGGMIGLTLLNFWWRRYPPLAAGLIGEHSFSLGGNRLVRNWSDDWGGSAGDARPLTDLLRVIEWVGFEGGFMEIVWRDGTRWRIDQWVGRPLPSYLGKIMRQHQLELKVERRGLVLRDAELADSSR